MECPKCNGRLETYYVAPSRIGDYEVQKTLTRCADLDGKCGILVRCEDIIEWKPEVGA